MIEPDARGRNVGIFLRIERPEKRIVKASVALIPHLCHRITYAEAREIDGLSVIPNRLQVLPPFASRLVPSLLEHLQIRRHWH